MKLLKFFIISMLLSVFGTVHAEAKNLECIGFDFPMAPDVIVEVQNQRSALPLRARLYEKLEVSEGVFEYDHINSADLVFDDGFFPPVVEVWYWGIDGNPEDDDIIGDEDGEELLPIHEADEGNIFTYSPLSGEWVFNLSAQQFDALGDYEIYMKSHATSEYVFETECKARFRRLPYSEPKGR